MTAILVFDVETTGLCKDHDQIIELAVQEGMGPGADRWTWRFLPSVRIDPAAQRIHGIGLDELAGEPPFAAQAEHLRRLFEAPDLEDVTSAPLLAGGTVEVPPRRQSVRVRAATLDLVSGAMEKIREANDPHRGPQKGAQWNEGGGGLARCAHADLNEESLYASRARESFQAAPRLAARVA